MDSEADAAAAEENPFSEIALERSYIPPTQISQAKELTGTFHLYRTSLSAKTPLRTPHTPFNVRAVQIQGPPNHDQIYRTQAPPGAHPPLAR